MTVPFVTVLRSRRETLHVGNPNGAAITIRVEMPEVWDVVAISVAATESVLAVKQAALQALFPTADRATEFVVKHQGWEILNEHGSLADAGVGNGSTLLLTHRRRRAVR